MCDTVLSSEKDSAGRTYTIPDLPGVTQPSEIESYFKDVHRNVFFKDCEVASGPQTKTWSKALTKRNYPTGKVKCGGQFGFNKTEFSWNLNSWHHPLHKSSWINFDKETPWNEFPGQDITNAMKKLSMKQHRTDQVEKGDVKNGA